VLTHEYILTTPIHSTALTAASTAFPPCLSTSTPISEHSLCCEATAPLRACISIVLCFEVSCPRKSWDSRSSRMRLGNAQYQRRKETTTMVIRCVRVESKCFLVADELGFPECTGSRFLGDIGPQRWDKRYLQASLIGSKLKY
jgi:hypothetical protein